MEQLINRYSFKKVDFNEYKREEWTLRVWFEEFEIYNNPDNDVRYLQAPLGELEQVLIELFD